MNFQPKVGPYTVVNENLNVQLTETIWKGNSTEKGCCASKGPAF
jgi:hypothetical protein